MKLLNMLILLLLAFLLSSCASTLTITNDSGKVKGIPFYTQKAFIQQETKYLYDWIVLSLTKEEKKDKLISIPIIQTRIKKGQDLSTLEKAVAVLNKPGSIEADLQNVIVEIKKLNKVTLHSNDINSDNIIENKWTFLTTVDYSTKYYLNSKLLWFGTSTLSQKLASNGTLSEATGTTDSQIDELVGVVAGLATPLSSIKVAKIENKVTPQVTDKINTIKFFSKLDMIDSKLESEFLKEMLSNLSKESVTYKLRMEEKGFIYTFTKILDYKDDKKADTPISFDLKNGNYKRDNWPKEKKETKKEEKPTINVSGTIQLPIDKDK